MRSFCVAASGPHNSRTGGDQTCASRTCAPSMQPEYFASRQARGSVPPCCTQLVVEFVDRRQLAEIWVLRHMVAFHEVIGIAHDPRQQPLGAEVEILSVSTAEL